MFCHLTSLPEPDAFLKPTLLSPRTFPGPFWRSPTPSRRMKKLSQLSRLSQLSQLSPVKPAAANPTPVAKGKAHSKAKAPKRKQKKWSQFLERLGLQMSSKNLYIYMSWHLLICCGCYVDTWPDQDRIAAGLMPWDLYHAEHGRVALGIPTRWKRQVCFLFCGAIKRVLINITLIQLMVFDFLMTI